MKRTFNAQFKLNQKLAGIFSKFVNNTYKIASPQQGLALFAFAVCDKTHNALILLVKNGFGQDALKLARTMYEVKMNLKFILGQETDEMIERYFKRTFVTQSRLYNTITSSNPEFKKILEDRISENRLGDIDISALKVMASSAKTDHPGIEKSHWTGKPIEEMAKEIGEQALYDTQYRLPSNYIHFDPIIAREYLAIGLDSVEISKNEDKWQIESLMMGYSYAQEIVQHCESVGLFDLGDSLKKLNKDFEGFDDGQVKKLND